MDAFEEFIKRTQEQKLINRPGYQMLVNHFCNRVSMLFDDVETYLKPYTESGSITLKRGGIKIIDWELGDYNVEEMIICIGIVRIRLKPITTNILGGVGRVDIEGPCESEILLLAEEGQLRNIDPLDVVQLEEISEVSLKLTAWYFSREMYHSSYHIPHMYHSEVTEDSFKAALMKLVEV